MIRAFKEKDIDNIMQIWLQTNSEAHEFIPEEYWHNQFDMVKEHIPAAEVYVYEEKGDIKGFVGVSDGYIAGIFVCSTEQSKGIGKQLIEVAKAKYSQLTLAVYEKNTQAINFYTKQDFKLMNKSVDENTGEVELHMAWEKQ